MQALSCPICKEPHTIFKCQKFKAMNPAERLTHFKTNKLCFNCCKVNVRGHKCSEKTCLECAQRHHTLLHHSFVKKVTNTNLTIANPNQRSKNSLIVNNSDPQMNETSNLTLNAPEFHPSSVNNSGNPLHSTQFAAQSSSNTIVNATSCRTNDELQPVLLPTAIIRIADNKGNFIQARALLDSGSNCNLISENLASKLCLPTKYSNINIKAICHSNFPASITLTATIASNYSNWKAVETYIVVPQITANIPTAQIDVQDWQIPTNLNLADPDFNQSNPIDILLGAGLTSKIILPGILNVNTNFPILQNSVFGWTISGCYPASNAYAQTQTTLSNFINAKSEEDHSLERFWQLEEITPFRTLLQKNYSV